MKKILSLLVALMMLLGVAPALAQTVHVQEQAAAFDVEITIPEDAEIAQHEFAEFSSLEINMGDGMPKYVLTIAFTEEIDNDRSMSDFTEDEKNALVDLWSEGMAAPTYAYEALPDGNLMLLLEENSKDADYAYIITVYHGYFFNLYGSRENYAELTAADLSEMYEIIRSLVITPVTEA